MFILGILLLICAALVGPLPGPGGILFGVPGLILVLRSSMWARRRFVDLKRWEKDRAPKIGRWRVTPGRWADLALRRRSALRREARRKQKLAEGGCAVAEAELPPPSSELADRDGQTR
ncbi:hypothetical protein G7077_00680 [Sphingomonas piscis]|uniref:Transmembrane protein (PGPGW) n=2 Tax=Sphingomonas piscis TaxID=2714943 RepID=A0A6G7YSX6_9SPHN|nr:hypothetical protein G7077_00680 [Sphingomonas piscis]